MNEDQIRDFAEAVSKHLVWVATTLGGDVEFVKTVICPAATSFIVNELSRTETLPTKTLGSIRKFPAVETRVESGPIQFGTDWPGTFIRGDEASGYAIYLQTVLEFLSKVPDLKGMDWISVQCLRGLLSELTGSNVRNHPGWTGQ